LNKEKVNILLSHIMTTLNFIVNFDCHFVPKVTYFDMFYTLFGLFLIQGILYIFIYLQLCIKTNAFHENS